MSKSKLSAILLLTLLFAAGCSQKSQKEPLVIE